MTGSLAAGVAPARDRPQAASWTRQFRGHLREGRFWAIQAMVAAITGLHVGVEAYGFTVDDRYLGLGLHHFPVVLYLLPVMYAGLRYGLEGSLLTGTWCVVLTVPNLVAWHADGLMWLGELVYVAAVVVVGVVVAVPVERLRRAERQQLRTYVREVTRAQEEERRRVALELHDTAAQDLVRLSRSLDRLAHEDAPTTDDLQALRVMVVDVLENLRRLSRDLRPTVLDDLGLVPALEWLAADLTGRGTATRFAVAGTPRRLPTEVELALFRITQEALRNAERHADAGQVTVEAEFDRDAVRVTVCDDGRGFATPNLDRPPRGTGQLGLFGMHERARLIGATLAIRSTVGSGTTITVEVGA